MDYSTVKELKVTNKHVLETKNDDFNTFIKEHTIYAIHEMTSIGSFQIHAYYLTNDGIIGHSSLIKIKSDGDYDHKFSTFDTKIILTPKQYEIIACIFRNEKMIFLNFEEINKLVCNISRLKYESLSSVMTKIVITRNYNSVNVLCLLFDSIYDIQEQKVTKDNVAIYLYKFMSILKKDETELICELYSVSKYFVKNNK